MSLIKLLASKKNGFIAQSTGTLASNIITKALAFIVSVYVAKRFGADGRGVFAYLILLATLGTIWGGFGIGNAGIYFYNHSKEPKDVLKTVWSSSILLGILGIAFLYIFLLILKPDTAKNPYVFYGAMLAIFANSLFNHSQKILLAKVKIGLYNLLSPSMYLPILLGTLISWLYYRYSINSMLVAWSLGLFITSVFWFIYSKPKEGRFSFPILYTMFLFGIQSHIGVILQIINYQIDKVYIEKMLPIEYLGVYAVVVSISQALTIIPGSAGTVLYPRAARKDMGFDDSARICRFVLYLLLGCGLFLVLTGKVILRYVFGPDFVSGYPTLLILLGATIFAAPGQVLMSDITGRGKPIVGTIAALFGVTINIALNFYLIPRYKTEGAAFTSLLSYLATSGIIVFYFLRMGGLGLSKLILPQRGDIERVKALLNK
jgi:O-antigen/teichoic acid export membrane protein